MFCSSTSGFGYNTIMIQWTAYSGWYLHLALIFCKHVNAGFQRRTFARTINFQLATIWKIPRDLCHILWRLFTIARQFPKYFSRQFVVIGKTSLSLAAERIWSGLTDKAFIAFNHGILTLIGMAEMVVKFSWPGGWTALTRWPGDQVMRELVPPAIASWLEHFQVTPASCWLALVSSSSWWTGWQLFHLVSVQLCRLSYAAQQTSWIWNHNVAFLVEHCRWGRPPL